MSDSEKVFEFKKRLRQLREFRGSGTELISVYIPARSPIHETTNKLREEMSQASNIKSKSTRTNVIGALERIIGYLKLYKSTPDNGIAVFCGNISDNPAKVVIELFAVEPIQSLNVGAYRCDSKFFLEPLERMVESRDAYGIIAMDGREATLAIVSGTEINIVKKLNSTAHQKVSKGGQCLAAGTMIVGEDGEIIDIETFKKDEKDSKIIGFDFASSKTTGVIASDFFITPAKRSIVIETKCPMCEIRATPYHRFFIISEHGVKEKLAKDLSKNDRILIARKINHRGTKIKIAFEPKTRMVLNDKERKKLREARIRLGLFQKEVAQKIDLSQTVISDLETGKQTPSDANLRKIYSMYGLELNETRLQKKTLTFPEYWNEEIARLFGIICGDGSEDGNRIIIYEGSKELVGNYCLLVKNAIGLIPSVRVVDKTKQKGSFAKKKYFEIRIYSLEFVNAIKQIAPEILLEERDIPKEITKCNDKIVAAFLSGLYDAEGYLNQKRVDIAMINKKLIQKIQLLLLRFGILSSFTKKNVTGKCQWCVSISDRDSVRRFKEHINFTRRDKREELEKICRIPRKQQYVDQIPIDGREVFRLAREIGLKTSDFHAASCFFRNKKPLGRRAFARNILSIFEKYGHTGNGRRILKYLKTIYCSDSTIASIKKTTIVENYEDFYDITVPVHSNFIANGLIVHNSQRRYQRLVEESIEKYYKRVGEAVDEHFLGRVKGMIVGGPGPTKDAFLKMKPFNYQIKVMGIVDGGYTDEYGIREVLAKSESILSKQEAVKEKQLIDRFMKEVVSEGLATYGRKEVEDAITSKQADRVLLSESLEPQLLDTLSELAREKGIEVEIVSTDTVEGAQFFTGFGGIGAFLRYRSK